jgi:hypothetical protein
LRVKTDDDDDDDDDDEVIIAARDMSENRIITLQAYLA